MNRFNVNKFDSKKNYIIEASAGTGKTYNIVEIVKKLVNEEHRDLNEILIVTYTEKAAGELKDRIRAGIKKDNVDVDNAPIYTIHSFCQNTIKEFGLSANQSLNLNVIDENEIKKFAARYVREGEILSDISLIYETSYGSELNYSIDSLENTLIEGVKKYYLNKDFQEDKSIVSLKNYNYSDFFNIIKDISMSNTFSDLCSLNENIKKNYENMLGTQDEKLQSFIEYIKENFKLLFQYDGNTYKASNFSQATSEEKQAFEFFRQLKDLLSKTQYKMFGYKYLKDFYIKWQQEKEKNKSQTFDDMIRNVREAIINDESFKLKLQSKYKIAIIDEFQDTNQKQFDIFQRIFMDKDDEHKIIVVGDPKQSIYSFQGADVNVYLDAVEAIKEKGEKCLLNKNYRSTKEMVTACNRIFNYYNFKGTDFTDTEYLSLDDNDKYIHEVKYDGKDIKAFWIATDENNKEIDENEFAEIAVQKIIDCCSKDSNGKTKLQIKHKNSDFRNVSFKDFAVLVKVSSEIFAIEKALKNAGIPFLRYKDKKLFLGKECADWIALLKALTVIDYTGNNRRILKKALFTNFFGVTLEVLNSEYFNKDDKNEISLMNQWKSLMYTKNWEDLFDSIIVDSNLTSNLKTLKEIQSLAIYKQIGNYCIDYLSKGKTLDDLVRNLTNLSQNENSDSDDENGMIVEKSTNFDCVQIMTMHASKGLQFPVVISFGGFKEPNKQGKVFTYHEKVEDTGIERQVVNFEKVNQVDEEATAEWKRLFYVAYTRAEFLLILPYYVKYGTENKNFKKNDSKPSKPGTKTYEAQIKAREKNFLRITLEKLIKNDQDVYDFITKDKSVTFNSLRKKSKEILGSKTSDILCKEKQKEVLDNLIKKCYHKKTKKHSYSSLSHDNIIDLENNGSDFENKEGMLHEGLSKFDRINKVITPKYNESVSPIDLSFDYPKGAKLGTALHEIFEGLNFENYNTSLEEKIRNSFTKQGIKIKEQWVEDTKQIVYSVMEANLPIINGNQKQEGFFKLNSISFENKLDEVEFNFNILTGKLKNYCNGFVDMIFKRGDYYSIVDWKSDKLNDVFDSYSNITSIKQHVDESYSIQRVLYSYCLVQWLKISLPELTEQEIFEKHFGGIYYIFLRGCNPDTGNGIYSQTWDSWEKLEEAYNQIIKEKVGGIK